MQCVEDYVKLNTDIGASIVTKENGSENNDKQQEDERMKLLAQINSLKDKMSAMKKNFEMKLRKGECEQNIKVSIKFNSSQFCSYFHWKFTFDHYF